MKNPIYHPVARLIAGAALLLSAPLVMAQQVSWSISVGTPYVQPVYAPQRVYYQQPQVYVAPRPVYVAAPRPVYVQSYGPPVQVIEYRGYRPYGKHANKHWRKHHGHRGHHGHH